MEKNIWIISKDKIELMKIQSMINSIGSLRAFCVLGYSGLINIFDRLEEVRPSMIIVDYDYEVTNDFSSWEALSLKDSLAGVPVGVIVSDRTDEIMDDCYDRGAVLVIAKPLTDNFTKRVERMAWQYEKTRNYENILIKQAYELKESKEIRELNRKLESRNSLLHKIFGRYFSNDIVDVILDDPRGANVGGEKKDITVMLADLRGFTALSEGLDAMSITDIVNNFLEKMTEVIYKYKGAVIEFMGDAILAVFGAPINTGHYEADAVAAAIEMQNTMAQVNNFNKQKGYPRIEMGIGINTGEAFVGNIGSEKMMRYNIMGRTINLCSRIEGYSVGGQVLISDSLFKRLENSLDILNNFTVEVKGIASSVNIYDVLGIHGRYDMSLYKVADEECIPLKKEIEIDIHVIKNKTIEPLPYKVKVKEMSNRFILIDTNSTDDISIYDDVEIVYKNDQGYAKVMWKRGHQLLLRCTYMNILKVN